MAHGCVINRHHFAIISGYAAFDAIQHFVLDADVREGAAHHDFVITATRAIAVEISLGDLMLLQVETRRRRSEEHTSELTSLMRISYAVFCLKKKKTMVTTVCQRRGE